MTAAVGLMHQMWERHDADETAFYRRVADEVSLADDLGFASLWIGEHHDRQERPFYGRVPSPELLMAHLTGRTRRIKLGTGVKIVPLFIPRLWAAVTVASLLAITTFVLVCVAERALTPWNRAGASLAD